MFSMHYTFKNYSLFLLINYYHLKVLKEKIYIYVYIDMQHICVYIKFYCASVCINIVFNNADLNRTDSRCRKSKCYSDKYLKKCGIIFV